MNGQGLFTLILWRWIHTHTYSHCEQKQFQETSHALDLSLLCSKFHLLCSKFHLLCFLAFLQFSAHYARFYAFLDCIMLKLL